MRGFGSIIAMAALCFSSPGLAAYEFYVKVKGVARDAPEGPVYLLVESSKDLDGDGANDEGVLRLNCAGGQLRATSFQYNVKSPRDAASGLATGRKGSGGVRSWQALTPALSELRLHLVNAAAPERKGWAPVTLSGAPGVCTPAIDAVKATKSRSNIQNN